ncbi:MAG: hypothetical protein ACI9BH_002516 [Paracoccaceae bacterium]|jgi:hypothetical protein
MSANVSSGPLPATSALHARVSQTDFLDCYSVAAEMGPRQAAEIITDFPGWTRFLLHI